MRQSESATRLVRAFKEGIVGGANGHVNGDGVSSKEVERLLNDEDRALVGRIVKDVQHASLQSQDLKDGWLKKQMPGGFGPVFALTLKSADLARYLPSKLYLFHHATSLGGVESLIEWRTMTDATVGPDVLRVSIGVEDYTDLLEDFLQAFRSLAEQFKV